MQYGPEPRRTDRAPTWSLQLGRPEAVRGQEGRLPVLSCAPRHAASAPRRVQLPLPPRPKSILKRTKVISRVSRGIGGCTKRPFFCYTPKKLKCRECHFWLKSGRAFIDLRPFSCQKWLSKFEIQISLQGHGSFSRLFLPASQAVCSPGIENSLEKLFQFLTNSSFWRIRKHLNRICPS